MNEYKTIGLILYDMKRVHDFLQECYHTQPPNWIEVVRYQMKIIDHRFKTIFILCPNYPEVIIRTFRGRQLMAWRIEGEGFFVDRESERFLNSRIRRTEDMAVTGYGNMSIYGTRVATQREVEGIHRDNPLLSRDFNERILQNLWEENISLLRNNLCSEIALPKMARKFPLHFNGEYKVSKMTVIFYYTNGRTYTAKDVTEIRKSVMNDDIHYTRKFKSKAKGVTGNHKEDYVVESTCLLAYVVKKEDGVTEVHKVKPCAKVDIDVGKV